MVLKSLIYKKKISVHLCRCVYNTIIPIIHTWATMGWRGGEGRGEKRVQIGEGGGHVSNRVYQIFKLLIADM